LVSIQPEHGVPKTLLEKAKKFKRFEKRRFDSSSKDDSIWIVFDRDEHPYVNTVLSEAKTSGISVAFSNPCFELWLLLHLQDHDAPEDRKRIQQILDDVCPSYSKSKKEIDFNALSLRLDIACERATAMAKRRFDEGNEQGNPYTNVYSLIKDIRMDVAPK
jgi:hypothetical protein